MRLVPIRALEQTDTEWIKVQDSKGCIGNILSSGGVYQVLWGRISSCETGRECHGCGKNLPWKQVRGGAILSFLEYLGFWEEYHVGKRGSGRKFWGRKSSCRELHTPLKEVEV